MSVFYPILKLILLIHFISQKNNVNYPSQKTKAYAMILILLIIILTILKYIEYGPLVHLSWWWIVGLFVFIFFWFEYIEPALGLDKKKTFDQYEKLRKDRIKKNFKNHK